MKSTGTYIVNRILHGFEVYLQKIEHIIYIIFFQFYSKVDSNVGPGCVSIREQLAKLEILLID